MNVLWASRVTDNHLPDVSQLSALLASGLITFLKPEQYPVVIPWLFEIGTEHLSYT